MIWYLLYPFRGTTEPPVLSDQHPIRRAFYRHGSVASRHWLLFLFVSVLISVTVLYSFFIGSPGFSTLPGHGWISAKPYGSDQGLIEDVTVRRVWVHGAHMGALEPHVLQEALKIQSALINDHFPSILPDDIAQEPSPSYDNLCPSHSHDDPVLSWGFHSPLMYWNCSAIAINHDKDLLLTVQDQSARRSYLNLTLLPASVFSGKSFAGRKLVAADALVITQFDRSPSRGATSWDARLVKLAAEYSDKWLFYPGSGAMASSQLYEYQRELISTRDVTLILLAYATMLLFVVYRLRQTRAVRSRVSLILAIATEVGISCTASFTICSLLGVDLSRIPQEMYPVVVVVIGLENMVRLMNAVLAQPLQVDPTKRIAKALGDVAHLSLASSAQNLVMLWILSNILSSSIQAFCVYAGFALLFDFCFHLIFFVAVLSVDVRRMELQDSIDRADVGSDGQKARKVQSWLGALRTGQLPLRTRVAGSAVCICFTLAVNMHFTESERFGGAAVRQLFSSLDSNQNQTVENQYPFAPPPINQARTPQSWLKLQDHQFAQEVLEFIKPGAHSMIARVYEPVIIVLKGSDRGLEPSLQASVLLSWKALTKHILPVVFIIAIFIGLITSLMDYLLWDNRTQKENATGSDNEEIARHIKRLPAAHKLDIFRLRASSKGHVVAVSLDKTISAFNFNFATQHFNVDAMPTPKSPDLTLWPVSQVAIDDTGSWVAVCSSPGKIGIWNMPKRLWGELKDVNASSLQPCLFTFSKYTSTDSDPCSLVIVLPDGLVCVVNVETMESINKVQLPTSISSSLLANTALGPLAISVGSEGEIFGVPILPGSPNNLMNYEIELPIPATNREDRVRSVRFASSLNTLVALRSKSIELIDFKTRLMIACLSTPHKAISTSFRVFHSPVRECRVCHSPATHSFSVAYTESGSKDFILRTFTAAEGDLPFMCFHPTTNSVIASCQNVGHSVVEAQSVTNPGHWEVTSHQMVVGVRQRSLASSSSPKSIELPSTYKAASSSLSKNSSTSATQLHPLEASQSALHRRISGKPRLQSPLQLSSPLEIWTLSPNTQFATSPLPLCQNDLLVASPGPIVPLGARSVALAYGNSIRAVTIGSEHIEENMESVWLGGLDGLAPGKSKAKDTKRRKPASSTKELNQTKKEIVRST